MGNSSTSAPEEAQNVLKNEHQQKPPTIVSTQLEGPPTPTLNLMNDIRESDDKNASSKARTNLDEFKILTNYEKRRFSNKSFVFAGTASKEISKDAGQHSNRQIKVGWKDPTASQIDEHELQMKFKEAEADEKTPSEFKDESPVDNFRSRSPSKLAEKRNFSLKSKEQKSGTAAWDVENDEDNERNAEVFKKMESLTTPCNNTLPKINNHNHLKASHQDSSISLAVPHTASRKFIEAVNEYKHQIHQKHKLTDQDFEVHDAESNPHIEQKIPISNDPHSSNLKTMRQRPEDVAAVEKKKDFSIKVMSIPCSSSSGSLKPDALKINIASCKRSSAAHSSEQMSNRSESQLSMLLCQDEFDFGGEASEYVTAEEMNPVTDEAGEALDKHMLRNIQTIPSLHEYQRNPIGMLLLKSTRRTYYGQMDGGVPNGWGISITRLGNAFEGIYKNGKLVSHARWYTPDGNLYEGQMISKQKHGKGRLIRPDGRILSCENWRFDKPVGQYEEYDKDHNLTFRGARTDKGDLTGPCLVVTEVSTIEGCFREGAPAGTFTVCYANGSRYKGELDSQLRESGTGDFTFVDGRRFQGPFLAGHPHGTGWFFTDSGKARLETWMLGHRQA